MHDYRENAHDHPSDDFYARFCADFLSLYPQITSISLLDHL